MSTISFGEEDVQIEVSINGQDFTQTSTTFKFVEISPNGLGHGMTWIAVIMLGAVVLIFALYIVAKIFDLAPNKEDTSVDTDKIKIDSANTVVKQAIPGTVFKI